MEVSRLVEDILSDEYEEGEILDEDILYENVSSLEEFSDPEAERKAESKGTKNENRKLKNRRKKEHKCKEDSVCRKDRSGKHCYARIRKRRNSIDLKSKNSSAKVSLSSEIEKKPRPLSPTRGSSRKDSHCKDTKSKAAKLDERGRHLPSYFQHDTRGTFQRKPLDRRLGRGRRDSADDRQEYERKRKSDDHQEKKKEDKRNSLSPSPRVNLKTLHEANVAKSSLLDRLVGSGSILQKCSVSCENEDCSAKADTLVDSPELAITAPSESVELLKVEDSEESETSKTLLGNENVSVETVSVEDENNQLDCFSEVKDSVNDDAAAHFICPADIPVPPTPKAMSPAHEPQKEEIDELHLRLIALKTAIIKKHTDLKRKKRLAASNKKCFEPINDSFTEFALMGIGDNECDSIPTPPPPGTDSWPSGVPATRDLDDSRWSDEDMVIDQESNYGDTIIEANIPASDPSLHIFERHFAGASSPSSLDELPCCKGNPIPVVTPHRPAKEVDERRPALSTSSSVIIPVSCTDKGVKTLPQPVETPKYLKEINSNLKSGMKRRRSARRPRRRRNSLRRRTPGARRIEKPLHPKAAISTKTKLLEENDDEDELRKLALMSVKPKNTLTGGLLAKVEPNLNPLHIETDPATLEVISGSPAKTTSPIETWEDLDEDILRAQLLSSLSRNIPVVPNQPQPTQRALHKRVVIEHNASLRKDVLTKRLNKENVYTKRNVLVHPSTAKTSKRNSKKYINPNANTSTASQIKPPVVGKFIINVSESDSSEDDEAKCARGKIVSDFEHAANVKLDLEHSIDKLLEEARKETELIQKASSYYPMYDETTETLPDIKQENISPVPKDIDTMVKVETNSSSEVLVASSPDTPDIVQPSKSGTSHLPVWQQEEFERQKRSMALKESVIEAAKEKARAKNLLGSTSSKKESNKDTNRLNRPALSSSSFIQSCPNETHLKSTETRKAVTEETLQSIEGDSVEIERVSQGDCELKTVIESNETSRPCIEETSDSKCGVDTMENEVKSCLGLLISNVCNVVEPTISNQGEPAIKDDVCTSVINSLGSGDRTSTAEGATSVDIATAACRLRKAPVEIKTAKDSQIVPSTSKVASNSKPSFTLPLSTETSITPRSLSKPPHSDSRTKTKISEHSSEPTTVLMNRAVGNFSKGPTESNIRSPLRAIANPTIPKAPQRSALFNKNQVNTNSNGIIHASAKKPLSFKDSSYAHKGLNEMAGLVSGLENGMSEYKNLEKDYIAQRKQLALTQQKLFKKKQQLIEMKATIDNKKRLLQSTISMDTSSLSPLLDTREQPKQSSRVSEILSLHLKEMCLKAQFAMMGLETRPKAPVERAVKTSLRPPEDSHVSPRKRMRLKPKPMHVVKVSSTKAALSTVRIAKPPTGDNLDPGTSHKLVISFRDKDKMDPLIPLCPYDMQGVCKDEECQYQHLQT